MSEYLSFTTRDSVYGSVLIAGSDKGICAILLGDDPDGLIGELRRQFPRATLDRNDAGLAQSATQMVNFLEAPGSRLSVALDVRGTPFQQRVWQALGEIPPGSTLSYADVAGRIGSPRSVRAVARACAANSLAVAIPCHRVVRRDGELSGYRWGVERKRALLHREAQA